MCRARGVVVNGSTCYKALRMRVPRRVDVAIVGGGFAGCATAWALGRRGIESVVLEREAELGRFASGRGAGLGRQLADDDDTTTLTIRGAELLRTELSAAWTPTGGILSFDDPGHLEAYRERARATGVRAATMGPTEIVRRWRALDRLELVGGLRVPTDGLIDPRLLLGLYASRARVVCGARVERVGAGGAGAMLSTNLGEVEARVVVDAAGAWAGASTGDPPLEAYRRHLFVLESAPRAAAPFLWHLGRTEVYLRSHDRGVLSSACDSELGPACDAAPDATADAAFRERLEAVSSTLASAQIVDRWACQRTFAPDRRMRLGRDPRRPWLVWAAGLGGHGATASAAVGERVAAEVIASNPA